MTAVRPLERGGTAALASGTVCVVRYHDGRATPNWGGRATSLALGRVARRTGLEVTTTVNGTVIVNGFHRASGVERLRPANVQRGIVRRWRAVAGHGVGSVEDEPRRFEAVRDEAVRLRRRVAAPDVRAVCSALGSVDEVWVNGEGDLILSARRTTLWRTLVLIHLAADLGVPVRLVNSILSGPPLGPIAAEVELAVHDALARCVAISYRDPTSLDEHRRRFPDLAATWCPDALFTWADDPLVHVAVDGASPVPFGPLGEGLDPAVAKALGSMARAIVVSGSSTPVTGDDDRPAALRALLARLSALGPPVVVAATCHGDAWMVDVARRYGIPAFGPEVPLATALAVVGRASVFVSGRYHPSILASLGGTPLVLMSSNSHKTASLPLVLGDRSRAEHPFLPCGEHLDALVGDVTAVLDEGATRRDSRTYDVRALAGKVGYR